MARQPFTVHWSSVLCDEARRYAPEGTKLFAIWPAPMDHDQFFVDAGFNDFDDADDVWDANADELLSRLLEELSFYGPPRLMSEPAVRYQPWYVRLFAEPEAINLRKQIEAPIRGNNVPDCIVRFGNTGVAVRTGSEHHIFWIVLSETEHVLFENMVGRVAGPHPVVRTELKWERLI